MKVLIAEDEQVSRQLLIRFLTKWGHEVLVTTDGLECYEMLNKNDAQLLILDWMMPKMDGIELIKKIRLEKTDRYSYIILLTAKSELDDMVQGFAAGADDYLTKPFFPQELMMRIKVGERIIGLEKDLSSKIAELKDSIAHIKKLEGLLPICMYCKKIRDEKDDWSKLEEFISRRSSAKFSHGICPECFKKIKGSLPPEEK